MGISILAVSDGATIGFIRDLICGCYCRQKERVPKQLSQGSIVLQVVLWAGAADPADLLRAPPCLPAHPLRGGASHAAAQGSPLFPARSRPLTSLAI